MKKRQQRSARSVRPRNQSRARKSASPTPARRQLGKGSLKAIAQPQPFTQGVTKLMVREHARRLYRDKLQHDKLTLEDWVLAEKDLVESMQTEA